MFWKSNFILGMPKRFGIWFKKWYSVVKRFWSSQKVLTFTKWNWIYKTSIGNLEVYVIKSQPHSRHHNLSRNWFWLLSSLPSVMLWLVKLFWKAKYLHTLFLAKLLLNVFFINNKNNANVKFWRLKTILWHYRWQRCWKFDFWYFL